MADQANKTSMAPLAMLAIAVVLIAKALHSAFLEVPTEATMGIVQRIFYIHVTSAFTAFLAFFISAAGGAAYLATRDLKWDRWSVSAAEVAVVFLSVNLTTGPIWAKPVWGIWWTWDARLTSTFVLWLMYVAYLMLRGSIAEPPRRAAITAVFSILAFLDVPLVYMSIRWWRTQHPSPVMGGGANSGLDPAMWMGVLYMMIAMLAVFVFLMYERVKLERARQEVEGLRREVLS